MTTCADCGVTVDPPYYTGPTFALCPADAGPYLEPDDPADTRRPALPPCMHRQHRKGGRQDLFCKRPVDHDGTHLHAPHPGGAQWSGRVWLYGHGEGA